MVASQTTVSMLGCGSIPPGTLPTLKISAAITSRACRSALTDGFCANVGHRPKRSTIQTTICSFLVPSIVRPPRQGVLTVTSTLLVPEYLPRTFCAIEWVAVPSAAPHSSENFILQRSAGERSPILVSATWRFITLPRELSPTQPKSLSDISTLGVSPGQKLLAPTKSCVRNILPISSLKC